MKKHRFFSLSLIAVMALAYGCSLDEYDPSDNSMDAEWSTAAGYEKKVNDCYFDLIRIVYGQAEDTYFFCAEGGTDIWQDANPDGTNGNFSKLLRYEDYGSANGMLNEGYSGFYGVLSACNAAVYYADKVTGLSEEELNALLAEARFIRAHALYNIVEQWGGKYLPLGLVESQRVSVLPCSSVNDFYKVILDDLDFARQHLPVSQEITGRVTRAAAWHLYAKACLTYSTYTDGLGNVTPLSESESRDYLEKAKEAADYLIDHAGELGVRLYDDIEEVFDEKNNKTNAEALFVVTHSTILAYNPRGQYYNRVWKQAEAYNDNTNGIYLGGMTPSVETNVNGYPVPQLAKGNCYLEPSKYMLDLYTEKDGRYEAFFKDTYYVNKSNIDEGKGTAYRWDSDDAKRYGLNESRVNNPAFDITLGDTAVYISRKTYSQAERDACRYAIYNIADNYADLKKPKRFFPSLKKADCPSLYCHTNASKPFSAADCIVYRLGETYLLAAEADWRLGDNEGAKDRLNTLRNRACKGHDHSMDITAADVSQDFLLDEYAREMIGEWNRWMTLKRFRAFETRLPKGNPQIENFNGEIHYLRPIPIAEILLIENQQEYQNPGY